MVKKPKSKSKARSTEPSISTDIGRFGSIAHTDNRCIGEVCYNEKTNTVEVYLAKEDCPTDTVKNIIEGIVTGARTSIILPSDMNDDDDE